MTVRVWSHVARTYDGSIVRLYVDGREDGSGARALNTILDGDGLTIGLRPGCCRWQGIIDDVQVYDRALAAAEIASIHAAGAAGLCRPELIFMNGFEGP